MHDAADVADNAGNDDAAGAADPTGNGASIGASNGSAVDRRVRFRESIRAVANRSSSSDLLRWLLVPASILLLLGFVFIGLGWFGASRTARQIEQIPYLISGGLLGLALVIVGALLLASAFWVVMVRKLLEEASQPSPAPAESAAWTATSTDGSTPTIQSEPPAKAKPRGRVARSTASS